MAKAAKRPRRHPFRRTDRAAGRQAGPGGRRVPFGRAPLRPDERPDVGRAAPGLEGRAGDGGQSAQKRPAVRPARSRRRHRRRGVPRGGGRRRRACASPSATSMPRCWPSAASARSSAATIYAVTFEQGNAEELPYPDRSFDCVTIAFGIRNVPRIERALARGLSRAADRRPLPVPGIFLRRRAGPRVALRRFIPST